MRSSVSPTADQGLKPLVVTYDEAAKMLGVCPRVVWQLVKDEQLAAKRIGRSVRIPVAELERFIESQQS